jgi:hypothetical protein
MRRSAKRCAVDPGSFRTLWLQWIGQVVLFRIAFVDPFLGAHDQEALRAITMGMSRVAAAKATATADVEVQRSANRVVKVAKKRLWN